MVRLEWGAVVRNWGSTREERARSYPCDRFPPVCRDALFRALDVAAPAPLLFRWLCQLRVAPYSYDWLDNFGRKSPDRLVEGLDELAVGLPVMGIFTLVAYEPDRHLTVVLADRRAIRLFGPLAASYVVEPCSAETARLIVKLSWPRAAHGPLAPLFAGGDLIMMRKQLRSLKALAERDARAAAARVLS